MAVQLYALAGVARCGATRANYLSSKVFVSIGGTQYATARPVDAQRILDGSLTINGLLNDRPNTAQFTVKGVIPTIGQEVIVTLGSINNLSRRFAGNIVSSDQGYVGSPANFETNVRAIDYTWGLGRRLVNAQFSNTTVAAIAANLIASYASGYTTSVASDIGAVLIDSISFPIGTTLPSALKQLATRAGGSLSCDYHKVVRLFFNDTTNTPPTTLTSAHPSLEDFVITYDASQMLTRVFVQGGGVNALAPVAVGETIIPLEFGDWYQAAGGLVSCGPQRIAYTGRQLGGAGSLVGPGASPSSAPIAALSTGSGIEDGTHGYAVTFVTGSGESVAGPIVSVAVGPVAAPSTAPTAAVATIGTGPDPGTHGYAVTFVTASGETTAGPSASRATGLTPAPTGSTDLNPPQSGGSIPIHNAYEYATTFVTSIGETTISPTSLNSRNVTTLGVQTIEVTQLPLGDANVTARNLYRRRSGTDFLKIATIANNTQTTYTDSASDASLGGSPPASSTAYLQRIALSSIPIGDARVTSRKVYRTAAGGSQLKLLTTIGDNVTTTFNDTLTDASLGANVPVVNTATANRIALSAIQLGATAVTARKVYRTVAGGSQLKLLTTIADNTTTTYADSTADGSLGVNVPTSDASGLAQPSGSVLAGATSILCAGVGFASATGGWVVSGSQAIRYTGISGNTLTGVPASGTGSITATISYNSTITAAATLTGIPTSGTGSIVYAITQGDQVNLLVQCDNLSGQAALAALVGGDGIQEGLLSDGRIGFTEATARGTALLEQRSTLEASISYKARDVNSFAGSTITVSLDSPTSVSASFLIQQVTESLFYPSLPPTFAVQASSDRFTFEDLLRNARADGAQ